MLKGDLDSVQKLYQEFLDVVLVHGFLVVPFERLRQFEGVSVDLSDSGERSGVLCLSRIVDLFRQRLSLLAFLLLFLIQIMMNYLQSRK